jgi:hypothetical protein
MDMFGDTKQENLWGVQLQKVVLCMIRFYMLFNYVIFVLAIPFSYFVLQGYVDKYAKG